MDYKITSERLEAPKPEGSILSEADISEMGVNLDALVSGGHLTAVSQDNPTPTEPKEKPNG